MARSILVVDDDAEVRGLIVRILRSRGHVVVGEAGSVAEALAGSLRRTEIQRSSSSIPGRDIVQVRTEIPAGVTSGWHTHPGEEVSYILAGTVQMEIRDRPTHRLAHPVSRLTPR